MKAKSDFFWITTASGIILLHYCIYKSLLYITHVLYILQFIFPSAILRPQHAKDFHLQEYLLHCWQIRSAAVYSTSTAKHSDKARAAWWREGQRESEGDGGEREQERDETKGEKGESKADIWEWARGRERDRRETKEERRAENFGPVRMNEGHFQAH